MSEPLTNVGVGDVWAPRAFPEYRTTIKRNRGNDLIMVNERLGEITGPVFGGQDVGGVDNDMTLVNGGEAIGERILVHGTVAGGDNKPVAKTLIEVWQAKADGR